MTDASRTRRHRRTALALACLAAAALASPATAQPWCGSTGLNPTETAICQDDILSGLDAELNALWSSADRAALGPSQARWLRIRNACGPDIFCIERAYDERIAALRSASPLPAPAPVPAADRRPWCGAARLNPAERTICGSDTLANLDAAMQAVYGALRAAPGDGSQNAWLLRRNECGADEACIAAAYLRRIGELGGRLRGN